ncbi:hypothetical protein PHYPO_G00037540 [Pangasianodon hypophthalmus]|uniref:Uncharacterized protein n=1 Tax=Pangasianodon hypophthalmus TaxID=310915 RepID=A0A5N5MKT6_PANHP|nr:hypothetical protein PHYPO_G00037540 [Pangasianodon hypophthalmus]
MPFSQLTDPTWVTWPVAPPLPHVMQDVLNAGVNLLNSSTEGSWARWWCCSSKVAWKFPQRGTSCPSPLMKLASPCSLKHHVLLHWLPSQGFNQEESMIRL